MFHTTALQYLMNPLLDEALLFVLLLNQTAVWYKQLVPCSQAVGFVWLRRKSLEPSVTFMLEMICSLPHNFSLVPSVPEWQEAFVVHCINKPKTHGRLFLKLLSDSF